MAVVAIGLGLDQRRAFAAAGALGGAGHGLAHDQRVHAVHHLAGDAVGAGAVGDVGQLGDVVPRHRHAVHVVLGHEDDGQVERAGHVQALVEGALVGGAIAEEADHHAVGAHQLLRQRRADGHRQVAAHDARGAQVAVIHVGDVHRAALALAVAARFAHHLGHHLVVVFLLGLRRFGSLVAVGVRVAMPAMGAGDEVVIAQRGDRAHRHRFFAGVEVRCAFQHAFGQQAGDVVFQRANLHDLTQVAQQIVSGELLFFDQRRNLLGGQRFERWHG